MTNEEGINKAKAEIRSNIRWTTVPFHEDKSGGQCVSIVRNNQKLISDDLDLSIIVGSCRGAIENRELAMELFEVALNKLIK